MTNQMNIRRADDPGGHRQEPSLSEKANVNLDDYPTEVLEAVLEILRAQQRQGRRTVTL